jgi:hypothetical protein
LHPQGAHRNHLLALSQDAEKKSSVSKCLQSHWHRLAPGRQCDRHLCQHIPPRGKLCQPADPKLKALEDCSLLYQLSMAMLKTLPNTLPMYLVMNQTPWNFWNFSFLLIFGLLEGKILHFVNFIFSGHSPPNMVTKHLRILYQSLKQLLT